MLSNPLRFFVEAIRALMLSTVRGLLGRGLGQPWKVRVLVELLRRDLARARVEDHPAEFRGRERPTPIRPALAEQVELTSLELAGLPTLEVRPIGWDATGGTLLYFHGGGYCVCAAHTTHRGLLAQLAVSGGVRVLAPDYRLAPEHRFPAAVDDALATWRALLDDGTDPRSLVVGGDSAGGGLALACLVRVREEGLPLPDRALLISPWVDLTLSQATIDRHGPTDSLSRELLQWFADHLLDGTDPRHPHASPLFAELEGLPPCLVQVGGLETLVGEARELTRRFKAAGVEVVLDEWPAMPHVFQSFSPMVAEADAALDTLGAWLAKTGSATSSSETTQSETTEDAT